MLRKSLVAAAAALMFGGFSFATEAAYAVSPIGNSPSVTMVNPSLQPAVVKKKVVKKKGAKKTTWVYSSKRHGPRYRAKRGKYVYYYGGYYYSRPWWTIGVPGVNLCIGC
jgi:hypothetical protein